MLHRCSLPNSILCLHDVTLGQGEETDWPAPWAAASSGRIPKDTQWPQPARTWWGVHSVCRRSSPSPTLRPKPRPSWVTCLASYQQPINVPTPKPKIQSVRMKKKKKREKVRNNSGTGWDAVWNIQSSAIVLKRLRAQHPSCPLATAIRTKPRRASHFPGLPSHPAPPIGGPCVCWPTARGMEQLATVSPGVNITNPVSALLY